MAQLDPEDSNHWQIKRGSQTYAVKSKELLLKIREEDRFSPSDLIRSYPDGTWKTIAELDWNAIQAVEPPQSIAAPSVPEDKDKITEDKITEGTAPSEVGWWRESDNTKTEKHGTEPRKKKLAILAFGVAISSAIGLAIFVWIPRQNATGLAQNNIPSGMPISPIVDPNNSSDNAKAGTNDSDEIRVDTMKTENAMPIESVDFRQTETDSNPEISPNAPQSVDQGKSDSVATVIDSGEPEVRPMENEPGTRSKGDLAPKEKNELLLGERQSASQIESEKRELDHIYDSIMAALQSSRSLQSSIVTFRRDFILSNRMVVDLEAGIASNNLKQQQAIALYAKAESELVEKKFRLLRQPAGTIFAQQLQNEVAKLQNDMVIFTGTVQTCRSEIANQNRKLEVEVNNRVNLQKKLEQDFAKEKSQLSDEFLAVDFFGDIPLSIHEKLFRETSNWILAEPDFFFAYLVNSASAIHLEKLDLPQKNLTRLREQISLLSQWEIENRGACLAQFEVIALAANGLSKLKQRDFSNAEIQIRNAFDLNAPKAELRFVAAAIAMERRKTGDALNHMRTGLKLSASSPRSCAITLQILNRNEETSKKILAEYLRELVDRLDESKTRQWPHHRYWLIAAQTAYRMGENEKVAKFLHLAEHPLLQEEIERLSEDVGDTAKDSDN